MVDILGFVSHTVSATTTRCCLHSVNPTTLKTGGRPVTLPDHRRSTLGQWACEGVWALLKARGLECAFPAGKLREGGPQSRGARSQRDHAFWDRLPPDVLNTLTADPPQPAAA